MNPLKDDAFCRFMVDDLLGYPVLGREQPAVELGAARRRYVEQLRLLKNFRFGQAVALAWQAPGRRERASRAQREVWARRRARQ